MRTHPLVYVNTVVIAVLIAGAAFLFLRDRGDISDLLDPQAEQAPSAGSSESTEGDDGEALRRVEALESRLSELTRKLEETPASAAKGGNGGVTAPAGEPGEEGVNPTAPGVENRGGPVSRSEVRALVREEMKRDREKMEADAGKKDKEKKKPRMTVADFSKQMGLDATQENELRSTVRNLQKDVVKLLFGVEKDEDLETLKHQLKQSEYDPELKAKLREKAGINYFLHQKDMMVLFVKAHSHLGKVLTPEQRKAVDCYDLQLSQPEFPDLEGWFEDGDEEEKKD